MAVSASGRNRIERSYSSTEWKRTVNISLGDQENVNMCLWKNKKKMY